MGNLDMYNRYAQPPEDALKAFSNGRFRGTDINPMWRIKALTEEYGECGFGWYTETSRMWREDCKDGTAAVFCEVKLYVKRDGEWSAPIVGVGGNTLERMSSKGSQVSDEAYKMAYTDALGIACKALGIGANVWWKASDGSKYAQYTEANTTPPEGFVKAQTTPPSESKPAPVVVVKYNAVPVLREIMAELKVNKDEFAALRQSLVDLGKIPGKSSLEMTEEDVAQLKAALKEVYGAA